MANKHLTADTSPTPPLVTVWLICHNHGDYVVECLDSLYAQDYPNLQCTILNNTYDAACVENINTWIANHDFAITLIQNEHPLPLVANLNKLLPSARGEYLLGLACDDVMLPERISRQVVEFQRLGEAYHCIYGEMNKIDPGGAFIGRVYADQRWPTGKPLPEGTLLKENSAQCFVAAPSAMYRRSTILELGGFDDTYSIEDWPFFLKFGARGYRFSGLEEPLVNYRVVPNSLGKVDDEKRTRELLRMFQTYRDVLVPTRPAVRKWLSFVERLATSQPKDAAKFKLSIRRWAGLNYYIVRLTDLLARRA